MADNMKFRMLYPLRGIGCIGKPREDHWWASSWTFQRSDGLVKKYYRRYDDGGNVKSIGYAVFGADYWSGWTMVEAKDFGGKTRYLGDYLNYKG